MGRQALLTLACLLAAAETLGDPAAPKGAPVADNESAESARLYRNVPLGVYASAAPYGAYSIQIPAFVAAPKPAASRIIPVTEIFQNGGFLKDSYGNRFVGSPQSLGYKFPQQFVPLQELPSHLSQPIVAAAPSYHHRQPSPFVLGSHYTYPLQSASPQRFGIAQPLVYAGSFNAAAPPAPHHSSPGNTAQQQSTSNQVVYSNTQPQSQFSQPRDAPKFQRLQEAPKEGKQVTVQVQQATNHHDKEHLQVAPKETAISTVVNGKKTVIHLKTNPPLPLLDLDLLEPLTFDNPLVPQVQHFLPRINQATYKKLPNPNLNDAKTYQKEFVVMKTKSYDSGLIKGKPQKDAPKKKHKRPELEREIPHENEAPVKPKVVITGNPNGEPEISYEINSPNYKETYKEQAISYNKETQSEPVHYTYGTKTDNAPVTYSYSHNTKEPLKVQGVHYKSNGQGPTQLVYKFKPEEQNREQDEHPEEAPPQENNHSGENTERENEHPANYHPREHHEHHSHPREHHERHDHPREHHEHHGHPREHHEHHDHPREHHEHHDHHKQQDHHEHHKEVTNPRPSKPEYREIKYHEVPSQGHHKTVHQSHPQQHPQHHPQPQHVQSAQPLHPITQYEEHIRIIPNHKTARIKVDPSQHVQKGQTVPQQQAHPSPAPQHHPHPSLGPQHHTQDHPAPPRSYHPPPQHIQEKSRRVIIQEETPVEMHLLREQASAEMIDEEENNEEDFEKAYKNAALGFPAFHKDPVDIEKDIYNPESYGVSHDSNEYNVEHTPFQEYQEDGDEYPKATRLNYKDQRDKTKEDYYLDYSVSRPESLTDRYKNKVEYYKLYKKQRPDEYFGGEEKKNQNQNAKYTVAPFIFNIASEKPKQAFAQYKQAAPIKYEYDYPKKDVRDSSAYASRPLQMYKSKTNFVEPQFQYGFEPISLPRLLDSELAAMASNHSPESEKPGLRKKLYKENWYIKKTSTSGRQPDS
ncbi:hypothetical protein O3G_MSEX008936 [Manduca sexta]|uniref:Uncharacterized protein n=1 Tax=Manduca sexta TaxID=7130 RepID=A0A922CRA4_MANSE|nr:hypothetical protein O3G_MSEX008936 [Manduca sexta]